MAQYDELVEALIWLLTNRVQNKINYSHGLLGDGQGRVRVAGHEDFVYARPDRFNSRTQQVFNKRVEGQDGDPIIIGELPWEPGLTQVISIDWRTYKEIGWGGDTSGFVYHGRTHIWKDAAPGLDTFPVYRRQLGDLQATASVSGTNAVDISSYSIELYGAQKQFPGTIGFPLDNAIPAGTGTARMALLYWDPSSGTTGYIGVATGTAGIDSESTLLNRPVSLPGTLPVAFVRLKAGQAGVTEFDIFDAREPFRPGIGFGTGSSQFNASLIPIFDNGGFFTGTSVESALQEIGDGGTHTHDASDVSIADAGGYYTGTSVESALQEIGGGSLPGDTFKVSELWESDFGAVAWSVDAAGDLANVDGESLTLNDSTPTVKILLDPTVPSIAIGGTTLSDSIHIQGAGSQGLRASNAADTIYTQLYTDGTDGFLRHTVPSGNANIFIDPIAPDPGDSNIQIWRNVNTGGGSIGIFMFAADGTATIRHQLRINDSSFFYQNDLTGTSGWGIGTNAMLDSARLTVRRDFTGTNGLVSLENQGDTTADRNVIVSFRHSAAIGAQIRAVRESGDADGMYLSLWTEPVGGAITERVRITSDGDVWIPGDLVHLGDIDTLRSFTDDAIEDQAGGVVMLRMTETTQNLVEIGDVAGTGDVDININAGQVFVRGSDGITGIGTNNPTVGPSSIFGLHVKSPSSHGGIFVDAAAGANAFFYMGDGGAATWQFVFDGTTTQQYRIVETGVAVRLAIDVSTGAVGIGTVTQAAQLHVDQASTTAAIPVATFDQADLSEEFFEFISTVGAGNPIDTAAIGTYYGKIRVSVAGVGFKYMPLHNS